MTVSIIVSFYNVEAYSEECVAGIVGQTYKDLDIILVDDGSTDSTGTILDKWAQQDTRIKVVHESNGGLSFARNTGMKYAKGDCIVFVDGDDALKESFVETLVNVMEETGADICEAGRYENVLDKEEFRFFSPVDRPEIYNDYHDYIYDTYTDKEKRFFQSAIVVWGKLYKKEIWKGIEFPVGKIFEDSWVFPSVMERCKKIAVIPEPLYFYRKRRGSIMSKINEKSVRMKVDSWMNQIRWWRASQDKKADLLLAACERYICHYIYCNSQYFQSEYKSMICAEYKIMTRHMIFSRHTKLKTKVKYLTFAGPRRVFR